MFSAKGQIINILGIVGHVQSVVTHTLLLLNFLKQSFQVKKKKNSLRLWTVQELGRLKPRAVRGLLTPALGPMIAQST